MLCDAPAGWIGVALGYAGMMSTNRETIAVAPRIAVARQSYWRILISAPTGSKLRRAGTHLPMRKAPCHLKHQARTRRSNQGETK